MADALQQAIGVASSQPVSRMGYASDVGIFCGVGGDTPTSTTGAWKRNRNYCPNGISSCPSIVANFSQRTAHPAAVVTQQLPNLQAADMLSAMQQGQFPTYQVPVIFTAFTKYPTVNAYKNGLVGSVYCTAPVLQSSNNGLNTFSCNIVISPANLTPAVYQAEQDRIAAATAANPTLTQASLFNYLAKPTVTRFSVLLQIDTPPFRPASRNFVVNVTRPNPDNFYPPVAESSGSSSGGTSAGGGTSSGGGDAPAGA